MTKYDFDKIITRRNIDCLKYAFAIQRGRPADVLAFWVADMAFPIAREIQEALVECCLLCNKSEGSSLFLFSLYFGKLIIPSCKLTPICI